MSAKQKVSYKKRATRSRGATGRHTRKVRRRVRRR